MPAPKKPAAKKAAARKSAAAAARGEVNGTPKTAEFRGLTLTLPEHLPASIAFDFMDDEVADDDSFVFGILKTVLGREQLRKVRNAVATENLDDMPEILSDLTGAVLGPYGLSVGKSEASSES